MHELPCTKRNTWQPVFYSLPKLLCVSLFRSNIAWHWNMTSFNRPLLWLSVENINTHVQYQIQTEFKTWHSKVSNPLCVYDLHLICSFSFLDMISITTLWILINFLDMNFANQQIEILIKRQFNDCKEFFNLKWMVLHPAKNTINLFCQFEMFSWWVGVKQVQVKFVISSAGDL